MSNKHHTQLKMCLQKSKLEWTGFIHLKTLCWQAFFIETASNERSDTSGAYTTDWKSLVLSFVDQVSSQTIFTTVYFTAHTLRHSKRMKIHPWTIQLQNKSWDYTLFLTQLLWKCIKEEVVVGFQGLAAEVQLWNRSSERSEERKSSSYKTKKKWSIIECGVTGNSDLLTKFG